MENRLKERLTGAAILVALIVLIVPEIFHERRSAPTPTGATTAAASAAKAVPSRSVTIELAPPPVAVVPPPTEAPRRPSSAAQSGAAHAGAETSPAGGTGTGSVSGRPADRTEAVGGAPPGARAARTAPIKRTAPARRAAAPRSGGWTVQLGLFAKQANAERLAHTAQSHGFAVQISRFGQRGLYRVAVTGIADRAAAQQLSHRLRGAGLPAAILGPR
ncbi:MAG TPA: SPOR domain-containing protein [Steroidobacteraceae bacterium]|nr:SPOR domain-containing protein [Steroidobacteraceae bacterium]